MTEELDKIMNNLGDKITDSVVVSLSRSIQCTQVLLDFVGDQKVSMKDHPNLHTAFDWLNAVRENLGKELKSVMEKNAKPADDVSEALENANAIN